MLVNNALQDKMTRTRLRTINAQLVPILEVISEFVDSSEEKDNNPICNFYIDVLRLHLKLDILLAVMEVLLLHLFLSLVLPILEKEKHKICRT